MTLGAQWSNENEPAIWSAAQSYLQYNAPTGSRVFFAALDSRFDANQVVWGPTSEPGPPGPPGPPEPVEPPEVQDRRSLAHHRLRPGLDYYRWKYQQEQDEARALRARERAQAEREATELGQIERETAEDVRALEGLLEGVLEEQDQDRVDMQALAAELELLLERAQRRLRIQSNNRAAVLAALFFFT